MSQRIKKLAAMLGTAAFIGGLPVAANATLLNGIVDIWTVDVSTIFDTTTVQPSGVTIVNDQSLRWGTPTDNGQSGLDIGNSPSNEQVQTNGAAVQNVTVTHLNRPITDTTLTNVDIDSTLTLTPFDPLAPGLPAVTITLPIHFLETPNDPDPCANGLPNGSGVNAAGCADIFVVSTSALNFSFQYDLGTGQGPQNYFISFFESTSGLNSLPAAACNAVIGTSPCLGFMTPENQDTTVRFAALITTQPVSIQVPEPGILTLVGAALLTLVVARRRRLN